MSKRTALLFASGGFAIGVMWGSYFTTRGEIRAVDRCARIVAGINRQLEDARDSVTARQEARRPVWTAEVEP